MADPTMLPVGALPPDMMAAQADIARKNRLAQALLQQGLGGPQPVSGRISPLAALASVFQAGMGSRMQKGVEEQQQLLAHQLGQRRQTQLRDYFSTKAGTPDVTLDAVEEGPPLIRPGRPGNPQLAATMAIGSDNPMLQKLGLQDMEDLAKKALSPKDMAEIAKWATPESVLKFVKNNDPSVLQARPEFKSVGPVGGTWDGKTFSPQVDNTEKWGEPFSRPGADGQPDLYQRNERTGQVRKLDNSTRITNVVGERVSEHAGKKGIDAFHKRAEESMGEAKAARADLTTLNDALRLYNEGIRTGSFTGGRNALAKMAETFGLIDPDTKTGNTDLFIRFMAERVLANAKTLGSGSGFSNTDRDFLEKIKSAKDITDSQINRFFDVGMRGNILVFNRHAQFLDNHGMPHIDQAATNLYRVPMEFSTVQSGGIPPAGQGQPALPASGATPQPPAGRSREELYRRYVR